MKRIFLIVSILFLVSSSSEAADLSKLTLIRNLKVLSNPQEVRVVVKTQGDLPVLPRVISPEARLLQMDIQKSYTDPSKRSFVIDDSFLEKVDIYQLDSETVRVRFYLSAPYEEGESSLLRKSEGFVVPLKRNKSGVMVSNTTDDESAEAGIRAEPESNDSVKEGVTEESFPTIFGNSSTKVSGIVGKKSMNPEGEEGELNPVVRMISSLAVVLGIFLVGAYLYREKFMKKGGMGKGKLIKVLDRGYVDVKKSIAVVDVAGEVLVLGVSGDNITLLTKLESEKAHEKLKSLYTKGGQSFSKAVRDVSIDSDKSGADSLVERIKKLRPI